MSVPLRRIERDCRMLARLESPVCAWRECVIGFCVGNLKVELFDYTTNVVTSGHYSVGIRCACEL